MVRYLLSFVLCAFLICVNGGVVFAQPTSVSVGASVNPICVGSSTVLTATVTGTGPFTYSWAPSTGLSTTTAASVTASPLTTTTYTITATNGTSMSSTIRVTVNPLPTISTGTAVTICAGSSTVLAASGGISYSWAPSTDLSSTVGSSVVATPTSTTSYTITGTNSFGCTNSIVNTVSVDPLPPVFVSPDVSICPGSSTALFAGGAVTYSWSPAGGLSAIVGSSVVANPAITTTYIVTGRGPNGCTSTAPVTVTVLPLPTISGTVGAEVCSGSSVALSASGAISYEWSPGATLSTTVGSSVTASPTSSTIYTVTGTDGNGCVNWNVVPVTVHALPYIFPVSAPGICVGSSTTLSVSGSASMVWSPSTGLASTSGAVVTASPTSTTTYTITGTDSHGCMNAATLTLTVYPLPPVSAGSNVSICNGSSTTLTGSGARSYIWTPGYGLSGTTGAVVNAHPATTTTYTLTGLDICYNRATVTVFVNPLPSVVGTGATVCMGNSAAISATGASTYTWAPAIGLSSTVGSIVTANPTSNIIYTVTGTDANGCVSRATAPFNVNLLPVMATSPGATYCDGGSATITASGAYTYSWAPAAGLSTTVGSTVVSHASTTTIYTVTGTSPFGCTSTASVGITVSPLPTVYSVTGGGTFCAGGIGVPVGLSGSQGGLDYKLLNGGIYTGISRTGSGSSLDFGHPSSSGYYTVKCTNIATGCWDTMTGGATILINPIPAAGSVTGGGNYCVGGTGVHVGMIGTVSGVDYQLYRDTTAIGSPVTGSGVPIDFGLQTTAGNYTAVATNPLTGCTNNSAGSATVGTLPLPTPFAVTGGGAYCQSGTGVHIGLIGSQIGAYYQVYLGGGAVGTSRIGLATALDFGLFTSPGVYTVEAVNSITHCKNDMSGSATVTINPTPVITGTSMILHNVSTTLNATPSGGTWSSQNPTVLQISPSLGVVTGIALGAGNLTYTLPTGCYSTHYITVAFNVGVNEIELLGDVSLSPNPNNGSFALNGSFAVMSEIAATVQITNMVGQVVSSRNVAIRNGAVNERIDIGSLPNGMYLLNFATAAGSKVIKFIKE